MRCLFPHQTFVGKEDWVMSPKSVPKAFARFDKFYAIVQCHYKSNQNLTLEDKVEYSATVEAKLKLIPLKKMDTRTLSD